MKKIVIIFFLTCLCFFYCFAEEDELLTDTDSITETDESTGVYSQNFQLPPQPLITINLDHDPTQVKKTTNNTFIIVGIVFLVIIAGIIIILKTTNLKTNMEEKTSYILLVAPALLLYLFVMAFPAGFSVFLSLSKYNGGPFFSEGAFSWGGLAAYKEVLTDPDFYVALNNNIKIVLVSVFGQIPLGFALAYIINRGLIKGASFFQAMIYLPNVIAAVIIGILFRRFFLSNNSIWEEIQRFFNPEYEYIASGSFSMTIILIVILWMYTGIYMLIFLANLQKIDVSVIEASKIDGASEWQTLRHIIFPALSGVVVTCIILAISGSLKSFDLIYLMTEGGPARSTNVLSIYMYNKAFAKNTNFPVANAISTIMVIICFILIAITRVTEKKLSKGEE